MRIGEDTAASPFEATAAEGLIVMHGSTGGRQVCLNLDIDSRNLQLASTSISTRARTSARSSS